MAPLSLPAPTDDAMLPVSSPNLVERLLESAQSNAYPAMIDDLARHLGVSSDSVRRLAPGWLPIVEFKNGKNFTGWWAIPERDACGVPIGLSLRSQSDMKVMLPGSKHGLVYEVNPDHERGEKGYEAGAHNWIRTMDAGLPCAVCGKPDGCLLSSENPSDPKAVICRVEKNGATRPMKFGWLHIRKPEGILKTRSALPDNDGPVIVVEGFSDTAAAMDLGFNAVGRPSNLACLDLLRDLLRGRGPIWVIGENDRKPDGKEPGRDGALATVRALRKVSRDVVMVMPPEHVKDLRAWKVKYGLTREQLEAYVADHGKRLEEVAAAGGKASQAEALVELASDDQFFHDGDTAYVRASVGDHCEVVTVTEQDYADVLNRRFYERFAKVPNAQAIKEAQSVLVGKAKFDGPQQTVHVRVAFDQAGNRVYLDLADAERRIVAVDEDGWRVVPDSESPVRFIRHRGMLPLPLPVPGGSMNELRSVLNLGSDRDWVLVCSWLLSLFLPVGTLPVLAVHGTQGSAKSTICRMLRRLFDPHEADLRPLSDSERELLIAARNSGILGFDNLSTIPPWLADALCRIASGSGFASRQLYSDTRQTVFNVRRSILLNGIPAELFTREDLRDRAIVVNSPPIDEERRRPERDLWITYDQLRPRVLGALLTAVSGGLKRWRSIHLTRLPRMSDYFQFAVAAELKLPWPPGSFAKAYEHDRVSANESAIENSVVGSTVVKLLERKPRWQGTCKDMFAEIDRLADGQTRGRADWPRTSKAVSTGLARILPALKAVGIDYQQIGRRSFGTLFELSRTGAADA